MDTDILKTLQKVKQWELEIFAEEHGIGYVEIEKDDVTDIVDSLDYLMRQNKRYRKALEFYANEENNRKLIIDGDKMYLGKTIVENDGGEKARQALEDTQ